MRKHLRNRAKAVRQLRKGKQVEHLKLPAPLKVDGLVKTQLGGCVRVVKILAKKKKVLEDENGKARRVRSFIVECEELKRAFEENWLESPVRFNTEVWEGFHRSRHCLSGCAPMSTGEVRQVA